MAFPSYRPLTQHDRKFGVSAMASGAAFFIMAASSMDAIRTPTNIKGSWLVIGFGLLLYLGGLSWPILNSRYFSKPWWKLLIWGGSCGGSATGLSQFIPRIGPLVPVGIGLCVWTFATAVIVFRDGLRDFRDYYHREAHREDFIPEYAIGTPRDPAWHGHGRDIGQSGGSDAVTCTRSDGLTSEQGAKI
jgi:hypothetical protein